ncbi:MAG TPA: cation-translocating P-type ATPase [Vicinamibacterales bacterium]
MTPFDINTVVGLSDADVAARFATDGYNELPASKPRSILTIALEVVREPMFLLLVASGSLYLVLGDLTEGLLLLAFVLVVMAITLYQQRKTERALEALRDLSSPRALVIRNGERTRIPGRDVVRGDVLMLAEGDRVPADAILLESTGLSIDESLLTGESIPVRKRATATVQEPARPGGDDLPFVFSGSLVVQGQGIAQVRHTGPRTELGKIGRALQTVETEATAVERETGQLVRRLAILGASLCVIVVVVYGLTRGNWLQGLLVGLTLAMATLPEEFPVVLTIFLALGAWRLSQRQVLTRRVPVIETLGAATVLCVDKTGTLTLNQMAVRRLGCAGPSHGRDARATQELLSETGGSSVLPTGRDARAHSVPGEPPWHTLDILADGAGLPEAFHEVVEFAILASHRDPFDPMEKAFKQLGLRYLAQTEHLHDDWTLVREYPLSEHLLAMSHVWKSRETEDYVIASKGAPEAIADLCHLSEAELATLSGEVVAMAADGLRVLGVARATIRPEALPGEQHDFTFELLGLVGLEDPVRPTAVDAVRECGTAGIRVVMITGDYPGTAVNIGRQVGLATHAVVTGAELDGMSDEALRACVKTTNIFARVVPEQKLRLVQALKANGDVVAMTGDGVNDAPALKAAHIGIAMGGRGTDVAREAASLVLLDDDFTSIVQAVRLGRRIFDNLKKAMAYILAIHIPIAGMSLLPVLFRWPLALLPVHIVFLELIIDPACSVVFEAEGEEANVMRRPPRDPRERLFGLRTLGVSLLQGLVVLVLVAGMFAVAESRGLGEEEARALSFTTLIAANIGLILANRSWSETIVSRIGSPNRALWWVVGGAAVFLVVALYVPAIRAVFRFSYLTLQDVLLCLAVGTASIIWFELLKVIHRRRASSSK